LVSCACVSYEGILDGGSVIGRINIETDLVGIADIPDDVVEVGVFLCKNSITKII
jgi:hypothetical protein